MAVSIRLKRLGRTNRPHWRICATDKRSARDGRVLEELGHYDPLLPDADRIRIRRDRVCHWLKAGATASDTVAQLLSHVGLDARGNDIPPVPLRKKKARKARPAAAAAGEAPAQEPPSA